MLAQQFTPPPPSYIESMLFILMASLSGMLIGAVMGAFFTKSGLPKDSPQEDRAVQRGRVGFSIMIGVITELLLEFRRVDAGDWHTWAYLAGAVIAISGYGQLAAHGIRVRRAQRREYRAAVRRTRGKSK
jgi:hypothetical protein